MAQRKNGPQSYARKIGVDDRPSKEEYYLNIADEVSKRSPCVRRQYGAVIVIEDAIVSTGYNGPARGVVNCTEVGCLKEELNLPHYSGYDFCTAVHAEENAVINAARNGSRILGGKLYLSGRDYKTGAQVEGVPCPRCKRALINAGIKEVVSTNSEGKIVSFDVKNWVEEDTKIYLEKLKEAKESKTHI